MLSYVGAIARLAIDLQPAQPQSIHGLANVAQGHDDTRVSQW